MTDGASLLLFLGSVVAISLSGVMMPGPVTAVTVTNGSQRKDAGALVALGHGLIEFPLIVLIYFGFARFLELPEVRVSVGLIGGLVLLWMAVSMFKAKPVDFGERRDAPHSSVVAGLAATASSPYFFLWWATVGAALLASARDFGNVGVVVMGVTHWLCDLGWLFFISWVVFKSKQLWTQRVHRVVFGVCATVLAGFGAWFIYSSIDLAVST
ncbi:MAG: LysE family transporter [Dehalococcoidia bacterium]